MIMAGRGKRLDMEDKSRSPGDSTTDSTDGTADLPTLKETIDKTDLTDLTSDTLNSVCNLISRFCSSKENMKDLLNFFHEKALAEAHFGEKLVVILEQLSYLEVNDTLLRGELLTLIQKDFEMKDSLYKTDRNKFLNAVTLLGGVYNRFKVCGAPIAILGIALLEYFDLLIKGDEKELKVLTKQLLINGRTLSVAPGYDEFQVKLRDTLVNGSSNVVLKYWVLLIIDLISNDLRPLKGPVKEFYVSNLKDDFIELESITSVKTAKLSHSPQKQTFTGSTSPKKHQSEADMKNSSSIRNDLSKNFSHMSVKTEGNNFNRRKDKPQISPGKNQKKDNWRQSSNQKNSVSQHDDRFEKDENYYGTQTPRQAKPGNRKFANDRSKEKEFPDSKTIESVNTDLGGVKNSEQS